MLIYYYSKKNTIKIGNIHNIFKNIGILLYHQLTLSLSQNSHNLKEPSQYQRQSEPYVPTKHQTFFKELRNSKANSTATNHRNILINDLNYSWVVVLRQTLTLSQTNF